jgi:hypothetical protein
MVHFLRWLTASKSTRTFSDFESVGDAMNGICQLYEQRLKQMNPGMSSQPTRSLPNSEICDAFKRKRCSAAETQPHKCSNVCTYISCYESSVIFLWESFRG